MSFFGNYEFFWSSQQLEKVRDSFLKEEKGFHGTNELKYTLYEVALEASSWRNIIYSMYIYIGVNKHTYIYRA